MIDRTIHCNAVPVEAGDKPVWIQLAKSGSFTDHPSGPFELNDGVFRNILAYFRTTPGHRVCIDYEHASAADPWLGSIASGGAPAQGWILDLKIDGGNLWGLVEWLPQARDQIRAGQYRYISPTILFPKAGGARLHSAALTNCPFLRGMQPLAAKDAAPTVHDSTTPAARLEQLTEELIASGMNLSAARVEADARIRDEQRSGTPAVRQ